MHYVDFTSLPPEEEATFVVYEARTQETAKKALKIGAIVGGILGVLMVIIVFSFEKPKNLMAGDDIGMLGDKDDRAQQREEIKDIEPAPTPDTATPSEASTAPTEAPAPEAPAPEAPAPETP